MSKETRFNKEIDIDAKDLFNIRIIDFTDGELTEVSENFGIDIYF
jgi:magnesium transporter